MSSNKGNKNNKSRERLTDREEGQDAKDGDAGIKETGLGGDPGVTDRKARGVEHTVVIWCV